MKRRQKEELRKSRAAAQAENYAINKYVRQLEADLRAAGVREKELTEQLKLVKAELKQVRSALRANKRSNKEISTWTETIAHKYKISIPATIKKKIDREVKIQTAKRTKEQIFAAYRDTNYSRFWSRVLEVIDWTFTEDQLKSFKKQAQRQLKAERSAYMKHLMTDFGLTKELAIEATDKFEEIEIKNIADEKRELSLFACKEKMKTMSNASLLDLILRKLNLRSTWFDSDASWNPTELAPWSAYTLYLIIMAS